MNEDIYSLKLTSNFNLVDDTLYQQGTTLYTKRESRHPRTLKEKYNFITL